MTLKLLAQEAEEYLKEWNSEEYEGCRHLFNPGPHSVFISQLIMFGAVSLVKTQRSYVNIIVYLAV